MESERDRLASLVAAQATDKLAWETAELCVLESLLRERLEHLGVRAGPELAVGLMAAAMLLAERSAEWGGDARDALGELALLGFALLGDTGGSGPDCD